MAKRKADMRAPLSIVIPTLNAAADLPATLACLIEGIDAGLVRELVVTDGGSTDKTRQISADVGAIVTKGPPGRGAQLSRGSAVAQGDWLLFLHADTQLSQGWSDVVQNHINSSSKAGYFRLQFRASGVAATTIAAAANLRSRMGLPYGDQGLLISRDLFNQIGGYKDMPLMEDVDIIRRLRANIFMLNATATTCPKRYQQNGWIRQSAENLWRLTKYMAGADPSKLANSYDPK